jgi:dTDP-4-dehydrorhamnose reductase
MRERILITGASGQLGNAVLKEFQDYEILAVDLIPTAIQSQSIEFKSLDITKKDEVKSVIQSFKPEIILNLAAMTDVDVCEENPELAEEINSNCLNSFLDEFQGTFVQISTDYVFNGEDGPYSETNQTDPINRYGRTKLNAEKLVRGYSNQWIILRTNVVYDYIQSTEASFVKWVVDSLNNGKSINVVNDQWNNPTWTVSLAKILHQALNKKMTGLFHYGGADQVNRYQFAEMIAQVFHLDKSIIKPISTSDLNQIAPRPLNCGLKTQLIESKLGVKPISLLECLTKIKSKLTA